MALVFEKSSWFQRLGDPDGKDGVKRMRKMQCRNVYRISQLLWAWLMTPRAGRERH